MCSEKKINEADHTHHPGQAGHDTSYIPASVRQYHGEPLHILVAYWCLQQNDWVNRNQISATFRISPQRASYLMSYLRGQSRRVVCDIREVPLSNNVSRYDILVTRVAPPVPCRKSVPTGRKRLVRSRIGNADSSLCTQLWNDMRKRSQDDE
ncbi:CaiF/GrlA family transcriptional regulator [Salmonella enterica subsp. enterica serovar Kottbus]|nr:CaiF/GrlA family transcriptional regulator [Salmonella enterica subsp. enterica serovar Kottbus]EHN5888760.1 CaiF/GrlA family transcriptional regulator [Salmonella enterica subsp. enterica serovar Newport]